MILLQDIPKGQRQQELIDYLNAILRARGLWLTSQARLTADGTFVTEATGPFPVEDSKIDLTWCIKKSPQGTMLSLSVESAKASVHESAWSASVSSFWNEIINAADAEMKETYFRRMFFYYVGNQLDGEYWLGRYRVAPAHPSDAELTLANAERILSIDQNVNAIDHSHSVMIAQESATRLAARLSLLLNIGLYREEHCFRWVQPTYGYTEKKESERRLLGFAHPCLHVEQMPKQGQLCPLGLYQGRLHPRSLNDGTGLSLPPETPIILQAVERMSPADSNAFDRGARLFQVAVVCGRRYPSVGMAYRVAAVEAVSGTGGSRAKFRSFMQRHVKSRNNIDAELDYLYGRARSAHLHSGEFPCGEFDRDTTIVDALMDSERVMREDLHYSCYALLRESIMNWLNEIASR